MAIDSARIRILNDAPLRRDGRYVLYWARVNRRARFNHALDHAADLANASGLPLLVYEELTCAYGAANDRIHTFLLEGVPGFARDLKKLRAGHFFYLQKSKKTTDEVLSRLSSFASCIVTDDYPGLSIPAEIKVAVDASCVVPMSVHEKRAYGAYTIRPKIRRELPGYLKAPDAIHLRVKWDDRLLPSGMASTPVRDIPSLLANCDIDHSVKPSIMFRGGADEARKRLDDFLEHKLFRYARDRNDPPKKATSGLSPYLHFGQISSLEIALAAKTYAEERKLIADEFLEELIVRRELAFNFARFTENPESLNALPDWCKRTMAKHANDPRPFIYTHDQFERASTHDELWNATQKELLARGTIHGYYRMYWGKKIIEWSPTYDAALRTMIDLHDKYALDGRDPNTYTNVLWCFGLHDRPWGERPVFGQLRYMSLEGMRRKTDTAAYIREIMALT